MKNASKNMYRWGNLVNVIYLALGGLLLVLGVLLLILTIAIEDFNYNGAGSAIGYGIWLIVGAILCFVFVHKAQRELQDENNKSNTPYILTIVFGAISGNPLYVLAGIFGLIAEGQQGKEEPKEVEEPKEEEKPVEEPKEE